MENDEAENAGLRDVILHYLGKRPRATDSWRLFFLYSDFMLA